jgi:hemerythrin-like domain-containing protein
MLAMALGPGLSMDPLRILMDEHRQIERLLGALDVFAADPTTDADPRGRLRRLVTVVRGFADKAHHGKEEDLLFVAMEQAGFPSQFGPLAVMRHEHDVGREHVGALAVLAEPGEVWTEDERRVLRTRATAFSSLLRAHIQKEDQVLYPMAEGQLSGDELAELARAFERHEVEHGRRHAELRMELEALVAGR